MSGDDPMLPGRRRFLVTTVTAGAGLTLGMYLGGCSREDKESAQAGPGKAGNRIVSDAPFEPNAFVRITPDDRVTVIVKHLEMGQGTYTGIATLVAEELDAAWSQVDVEGAPADAARYNNLFWGKLQGTGGSTAIANSYEQMRKAGAAARAMLVAAAAKQWGVPPEEISVRDGVLRHAAKGIQASFGELAELAAQQPVPEDVFLKEPRRVSPDRDSCSAKRQPRKGRRHGGIYPGCEAARHVDGAGRAPAALRCPGQIIRRCRGQGGRRRVRRGRDPERRRRDRQGFLERQQRP